jgi:hypothetical protein
MHQDLVVDLGEEPHDGAEHPESEGGDRVGETTERKAPVRSADAEPRGEGQEGEKRRHGADQDVLEHVRGEKPALGETPDG